ncbi:MAG: zinc-ribbon domain-containing protein, partial [Cyanobacteriota bacterium]|nr:zinc-ribbon domain-containing protein [Cyanobacteriota bacterium]
MLICPNCEFENPTTNKFCQQCGTLLETWRAVIIEAEPPRSTDALTALSPPPLETPEAAVESGDRALSTPLEEAMLTEAQPLALKESAAVEGSPTSKPALDALDSEQRYRVCTSDREAWIDWQENSMGWLSVEAWDTQPSQKTFLEVRLAQNT